MSRSWSGERPSRLPDGVNDANSVPWVAAKILLGTTETAHRRSKLANILFTRALAQRLRGTAVTATCLHPGFVRTNFGRGNDVSPLVRWVFESISRFARSPEKGPETLIYLASSPEVRGASGGYYFDCKRIAPSAAAEDAAAAERLWRASERLIARWRA